MTTKKQNAFIALCDDKINELKATIAKLKTDENITKATRGTQLYARGRERRTLALIRALLSQIENPQLSEEDKKTFVLLTTLAEERQRYDAVEVHEGDLLIDILKKYAERKDIMTKINKACEKNGLTIDYSQGGVFVPAQGNQ